MANWHKVFVSYYHEDDQHYRERFETLFSKYYDIMESKSVEIGDIDPNLKTETIYQKIRNDYLRNSTVTVVFVGKNVTDDRLVKGMSFMFIMFVHNHYPFRYAGFDGVCRVA